MSKLAKANCFRNLITCHEGQHVVVRLVGGRIIEGQAYMHNQDPYIIEKDGCMVAPIYDNDVQAVWPQYYTKWIDAEEFGDDVFLGLEDDNFFDFIDDCEFDDDDFTKERYLE